MTYYELVIVVTWIVFSLSVPYTAAEDRAAFARSLLLT